MTPRAAKEIGNVFGWLILAAAAPGWGIFFGFAKSTLSDLETKAGFGLFAALAPIILNPAFLLANAAAILLILKHSAGFICLYVSILAGLLWLPGPVLPWLKRIFPAGPEFTYYMMAANVTAVVFLSWCHWTIAAHEEPRRATGMRRVIIGFLLLLIASLIFWKTGNRTGNGEVQKVAEVPAIGPYLSPLESTQPILFRSDELLRKGSSTVVFRGMTSEQNIQDFAAAHKLTLITNDSSRVKIIPQSRSWKLDPDRFPVFTNATDLCYIGRIPTNSQAAFQLSFRPGDGRFTALSFGNPAATRAANKAAPPQN
jgi:hypothetical protein